MTTTTDLTDCAQRTIWTDGPYRVVHSRSLFGLSDRYYALRLTDGYWDMLRRCRKPGSAWRAVEKAKRADARAARRDERRQARRKAKARAAGRRRRGAAKPQSKRLVLFT